MTTQNKQASESQQMERYSALKAREVKANNDIIWLQSQHATAKNTLEEESARIMAECGTDNIDELKQQYRQIHASNEKILSEMEANIIEIESITKDIKSRMESIK
jgi:hypothetical protein